VDLHLRNGLLRAAALGAFAIGLLLPGEVSAAAEGGAASTGTLVGGVTCGADEITPAANAIVSVAGLTMQTRADSGGRFTLTDVPAGERVRIDATSDRQQSSMTSRFDVVAEPGQTLDIGSVDLAACPAPSTPTPASSDHEMEQRGNPND
jgi:hypothetical protein